MNNKLNLEDKLKRLKEIQTFLESKPPLTESMELLGKEECIARLTDI